MSKPVKEMIIETYRRRFGGVESGVVVDLRGMNARENNRLRLDLRKKEIRIAVLSNSLARKAFAAGGLKALVPVLQGPSALAWGAESVVDVARELMAWARKVEKLRLKAAVLDGRLFEGPAGVEALSRYPTRDEAVAQVVHLVGSPAADAVGTVAGPGGALMAVVQSLIERLEKGETIAAAG